MVYILASNIHEASQYARQKGLKTLTGWRYLRSPESLRGMRAPKVVRVGLWELRADARRFVETLEEIGAEVTDDTIE